MALRKLFFRLAALSCLICSAPAGAQGVDIIRGRVMGPDALPVAGVLVAATTLSGQVTRSARTDKNGRYTISFPGGEGDYWVTFSALGFGQRRYEVKRTADQEILIADARLSPSAVSLDAVTIRDRSVASRGDTLSDVSGTEKAIGADNVMLAADQMGDLAAMVASIPGVQLLLGTDGAADMFSVFGLGGDQNNTQLNGLNFGDSNVPRDANVSLSLVTSPYDVSRGGFSGGQLQVRTRSGSNFAKRNLSWNLIAPQTEWLDKAALATSQQYTRISAGGATSGPFSPDRAFYNLSFQYDRRLQDVQTLLSGSSLGYETVGVSGDSVSRLRDLLNTAGVPLETSAFPGQKIQNIGSMLGSFDFVPQNSSRGNTFAISFTGNGNHTAPAGGGQTLLTTPGHSGVQYTYGGTLQARMSGLLGLLGIFQETNVGYSNTTSNSDPYLLLPSGTVRVNSALADGSASIQNLTFGGSPSLNTASSNGSLAGTNTLSMFSNDNRHRIKLTSELRRDTYWQDFTNNQLGTFTYNSLTDFQANTPASFTRALSPRRRSGAQVVGALSLGDAWRPINDLQVQYGVRMDANRFEGGPTSNPAVISAFHLDNAEVPNKVYVSPRVGFAWTYGQADQMTLLPGMVRAPRAVVRGGIGVFQNTPGTSLIGGAIDNTGLPSGVQQLTCIGVATPIPDWNLYRQSTSSIPSTCADGTSGTVFSSTTPNVTLFDPNYSAQRSLRSNLQWSGAILHNLFQTTIEATWSRNQHQAGNIDLNFAGVQQFALSNEDNRPIYVDPASIVTTTGQIAWRNARLVNTFGRVTEQRSDLQSESRQLTVNIRPISYNTRLSWSLAYVLADVREQFLGFASTTGSPLSKEWSAGQNFSRHQIQYSINYNWLNTVIISWGGNIRSGVLYTPTINGDVNGDSYSNDRAFIYDPAKATDPTVASGMANLLATGTKEAKACLLKQMNALATRNSCIGPWTTTGNLSVAINSLRIGLPQRATLSFQVGNPLGGIDRLINGENDLKGWGSSINPDGQLLYVRGFDPISKTFHYEVNQRFGSTRPAQNGVRTPVSITALLRLDIGPTRERTQLLQQLDRGRTRPGTKANVQQLRGSANIGLINPLQQLLQQADTLKLTRKQADSLATLNRWYVLKSDSIWAPVAKLLADLPEKYSRNLAYDRYIDAREQSVDLLIKVGPGVKKLLTDAQYRILPTQLAGFLDKRTLQAIRAGTAGNSGTGFTGGSGGGGGGGGRGGRGG